MCDYVALMKVPCLLKVKSMGWCQVMRGALRVAVSGVVVGAVGCSPALNWRNVAHEGAPVAAMLPCKPELAQRQVPSAKAGMPEGMLSMMACEADGATFAFAAMRWADAESARVALKGWPAAMWRSLGVVPAQGQNLPQGWVTSPWQPGWADEGVGWQGPGRDHQGRALQARAVFAQKGPWVFQAAVYGPKVSEEVSTTFFDSLGVR